MIIQSPDATQPVNPTCVAPVARLLILSNEQIDGNSSIIRDRETVATMPPENFVH